MRAALQPLDDALAAELTARVVAGDADAYEALFRHRCGLVEAAAAHRLGRRHDLAEDVAQETWIRVARAPRACPGAASLDAWLRMVVRSAAIDLLRSELSRRARELTAALSRPEAAGFIADIELLEQIRTDASCIDGLTAEDRALLELRARADATLAQIAALLGIGAKALDSRLRRAEERARRRLRGHGQDSIPSTRIQP